MKFFRTKTNWIKGSDFEKDLKSIFKDLPDQKLRQILIKYYQSYQEDYCFDQLKNVFDYLELKELLDEQELKVQLSQAKKDIEDGMGEYFISLNEISTGLNRILDPKELSYKCIIMVLNHALEAHSCNESKEVFLKRELEVLSQLLKEQSQQY